MESEIEELAFMVPPDAESFGVAEKVWLRHRKRLQLSMRKAGPTERASIEARHCDLEVPCPRECHRPASPRMREAIERRSSHASSRARRRPPASRGSKGSTGQRSAPREARRRAASHAGPAGLEAAGTPAVVAVRGGGRVGRLWGRLLESAQRASAFIAVNGWDLRLKTKRRVAWSHGLLLPATLAIIWLQVLSPRTTCGLLAYVTRGDPGSDWGGQCCSVPGTLAHSAAVLLLPVFQTLPIAMSWVLTDEAVRRLTPFVSGVTTQILIAASHLIAAASDDCSLATGPTHTPAGYLVERTRDTFFYPALMCGALNTGIPVPVWLELGGLAGVFVLNLVAYLVKLRRLAVFHADEPPGLEPGDPGHDAAGDPFFPDHGHSHRVTAGHYGAAVVLALMGFAMYATYSFALWGSFASQHAPTQGFFTRMGPTVLGICHLAGWALWTLMVGLVGTVVVLGSARLGWLGLDLMAAVALLLALVSVFTLRVSSYIGITVRNQLIRKLLPEEASLALLDTLAKATQPATKHARALDVGFGKRRQRPVSRAAQASDGASRGRGSPLRDAAWDRTEPGMGRPPPRASAGGVATRPPAASTPPAGTPADSTAAPAQPPAGGSTEETTLPEAASRRHPAGRRTQPNYQTSTESTSQSEGSRRRRRRAARLVQQGKAGGGQAAPARADWGGPVGAAPEGLITVPEDGGELGAAEPQQSGEFGTAWALGAGMASDPIFTKTGDQVTLLAIEVPSLGRVAQAVGDLEAARLAHQVHCALDAVLEGLQGPEGPEGLEGRCQKVSLMGGSAAIVAAFNLGAAVEEAGHQARALRVAGQMHRLCLGLPGWAAVGVAPQCKMALHTGPAVASLLGRSKPVLMVVGEACQVLQGLLDSTPAGRVTASQGFAATAGETVRVAGLKPVELYVKGLGMLPASQVELERLRVSGLAA